MSIFEKASRLKVRFDTGLGSLTVENLWDLPLTSSRTGKANLDAIAIELHNAIEAQGTTSFVSSKKKDDVLQLKFEVVKHIIDTKVAENEAKVNAASKQSKRDELDALISRKETDELAGKSVEDLKAMRDAI